MKKICALFLFSLLTSQAYAAIPSVIRGDMESLFFHYASGTQRVQAMLPPELELAEQSLTPAGTHIVEVMYGSLTKTRPAIPGMPDVLKPFAINTHEIVINIPYVKFRDHRTDEIFSYALEFNVDNPITYETGKYIQKFNATMGLFSAHEHDVWFTSFLLAPEMEFHWTPTAAAVSFASASWSKAVSGITRQRYVSKTNDGRFVCTLLSLNLSVAKVAPATIRFTANRSHGVFNAGEVTIPSADTDPMGGYTLRTKNWELPAPVSCY